MQNVREVRKLLLKLPPGVETRWLERLESQFDWMSSGHDPEGCTIGLCQRLLMGDEGREWSGVPPVLTRMLIAAIAYGFPSSVSGLVGTFKRISEWEGHHASIRIRRNDQAVLTAFLTIPTLGNLRGLPTATYHMELTQFLHQAMVSRFFRDVRIDPSQCSALSSAVKDYFGRFRFHLQDEAEIMKLLSFMCELVQGDKAVSAKDLETVLVDEFLYKAFNALPRECKGKLIAQGSKMIK